MTEREALMIAKPGELAAELRSAYLDGPVTPLAGRSRDADVEAAYAIQEANTRFWIANGRIPVGRKIGLTSPAVQRQLGVDQPDYGVLFDDMFVADGGTVAAAELLQPKIEAEIAFIMGAAAQHAHLGEERFLAAVDSVHPALEIVDSRIADWKITLFDTIADNASSGMFVLGAAAADPLSFDYTGCAMRMDADGVAVSEGAGAACLGSPVKAGLWLAKVMAERGRPLRSGDVVLSGALGPMVTVTRGATYRATIEGLGDVSVSFAP
jgi:2-keto-4-pentenoate hydratase